MATISTQPEETPEKPPVPGPVDAVVRLARKILITIVGTTVLIVGVIMIVAPGPAFVVIPLGLGILGTEFLWARRMLQQFKQQACSVTEITLGALFRKSARNSIWPSKTQPGSAAISTIILPGNLQTTLATHSVNAPSNLGSAQSSPGSGATRSHQSADADASPSADLPVASSG